jgi:hypothetical protein
MSHSLPSREVYAVDVPEVKNFHGEFHYNFFVPDESVSETGGVPSQILERPAGEVDASFIQYSVTRAPRFVRFTFSLPRLVDPGKRVTDHHARNLVFDSGAQNGSLIHDNLDKVITEDHFASDDYVAVNFHDGELDDKIHYLVSSSYEQHTMDHPTDHHVGHYKAATRFHAVLPKHIKPHFVFRHMTHPTRATGTRFFTKGNQRIFNQYFRRLHRVLVNAQINGKLFHDITNRSIKDPNFPFAADMENMHAYTKKVQHKVQHRFNNTVHERDFKTFVPFIDVTVRRTTHHHDQRGAEIVGYIIDKAEINPDGSTRALPPVIVDNPKTHLTADYHVKYGHRYVYSIRTVAQFKMPAIDDDTGDVAMLKILVSSKPSTKIYVQCIEAVAPPAPSDLNFTWNYERINPTTADHDPITGRPEEGTGEPGSLLVHWTFPPNSQRDIKKFQVFRRRDTNHPFELIKMYDFDDSVVKYPNAEQPHPALVEHLRSPCTFFYDDEFVGAKHHNEAHSVIYAIAAIDAHGFTSSFSAQFAVWFDPFKNQLQKKLISHAGAPKPYPNLYLEADTFVDTIRVAGPNAKTMRVYFNPEYYHLYDDNGRLIRVLATKQTGGQYKLQFINLDNQKSAVINININDRIRAASKTIKFPDIRFGNRRKRPQIKLPG